MSVEYHIEMFFGAIIDLTDQEFYKLIDEGETGQGTTIVYPRGDWMMGPKIVTAYRRGTDKEFGRWGDTPMGVFPLISLVPEGFNYAEAVQEMLDDLAELKLPVKVPPQWMIENGVR